MIFVDDREPKTMVGLLEKRRNVVVTRLDPADYVIGNIGIERKTISDFLGSLASGRLLEQLSRLRAAYEQNYLLIEGLLDWSLLKNPTWFCYTLQHIVLSGVPVLFSSSLDDSANVLARLYARTCRLSAPVKVAKTVSTSDAQLAVLCAFPGVGVVRARRLLSKFTTIRSVFNRKTKDFRTVGVGRKTARSVTKLLDLQYIQRHV